MSKKGVHDMGGDPAGPVDRHEHTPTLTERRIDAVMQLLRQKPRAFWRTDENRRTLESLAPEVYEGHGYYARWTLGMRSLLVEKGVLTAEEIEAKLADVRARYGRVGAGAADSGRARGKAPRRKAAAKPAASARAAEAATGKATTAKAKAATAGSKKPAAKAATKRKPSKAAAKARTR